MTNTYMKAVLEIANSSVQLRHDLLPLIDQERDEIRWDKIQYGVFSGGVQTAFSWAYVLWTNEQNKDWRDPFEGFGNLDQSVQRAILKAMILRHGVSPGGKL